MVRRVFDGARQAFSTTAGVARHLAWYVTYQLNGSVRDVPDRSPAARRADARRREDDVEE